MYKALFQNSKVALAFVGMTVLSAVSMVGTSQDAGVVTQAVDLVEAQRESFASNAQAFAETQSGGDKPSAREASVFGDYAPEAGSPMQGTATPARNGANPMTAPLAPTAVISNSGPSPISTTPFISEREMTIEPE